MPHAIERDRELRDQGLVTVFLESQGASIDQVPGFLWAHWPGFDGRVASNSYLPLPEHRGIPHASLIGVDGTLLWDGSPMDGDKVVKQLLADELEKVQKGWGPNPETKKVRAQLYGKQNLAEAKKLIDAIADATLQGALRTELDAVRGRRVHAVQALRDQDRWAAAKDALQALQKSTAGVADWQAEVAAQAAAFDTPEAKKELATDEKFERIAEGLRSGKQKANASQLLTLFAQPLKSGAGTKVAARWQRLFDVAKATPRD